MANQNSSTVKYEIKNHDIYGRHLVAAKDFKMGEIIFQDDPVVLGPKYRSEVSCLNCCKQIQKQFNCCKKCKLAPLCHDCEDNQVSGWHKELECETLSTFKGKLRLPMLLENLHIITVLRALLLRKQNDLKNWERLMDLENHLEDRRQRSIWKVHEETTKAFYDLKVIDDEELKDELVQKTCGILDVNNFELRASDYQDLSKIDSVCGIFPLAAMMAHSCIANIHLAVDNDYHMIVRASVEIKEGSPIFYNYTEVLQGAINRRDHLRIGKYFECTCERCSDATEFGLHLNSLICKNCKKDRVITNNPLNPTYLTKDDEWHCMDCKCTYNGEEIKEIYGEVKKYSREVDKTNAANLEDFLSFALKRLNPNHHIILDIKHLLAGLWRNMLSRANHQSKKLLQKKLNICNDFIKILDVLEPGISRLKAITLYESHVPIVHIGNKDHEKKEITTVEYLAKLNLAKENLKESIRLLLFEPMASPEGSLCRRAMEEMKRLQIVIDETKFILEEENKKSITIRTKRMKNKLSNKK